MIQAFAAGDPALAAAANGPADVILVDSPDPGSGRLFDWKLAEGAPGGVRLLLAGGLTADNVGDAIRRVRPWGVDVASGVEVVARAARTRASCGGSSRAAHEAGDEVADDERPPAAADGPYDWEVDELAALIDWQLDDAPVAFRRRARVSCDPVS